MFFDLLRYRYGLKVCFFMKKFNLKKVGWLLGSGSALDNNLDRDPHSNQCGSTTLVIRRLFCFLLSSFSILCSWRPISSLDFHVGPLFNHCCGSTIMIRRIQLFISMWIRIQPYTLARIRIQFFSKVLLTTTGLVQTLQGSIVSRRSSRLFTFLCGLIRIQRLTRSDPEPAFHLGADTDLAPASHFDMDQTLKKNIFKIGIK
jgi:hypothetical protein